MDLADQSSSRNGLGDERGHEDDVVRVGAVQLQPVDSEAPDTSTAQRETTRAKVGPILNSEGNGGRRASLPGSFHQLRLSAIIAETPPRPVKRRHSSVVTVAKWSKRPLLPIRSEFYLTFGPLGVPMVVAFLSSAVTLFALAIVQVIPTETANFLMKTSNLDKGEFWLLKEPPPALVVLSVVMLVVCGCCYLALAYSVVFSRKRMLHQPTLRRIGKGTQDPITTGVQAHSRAWELLRVFSSAIRKVFLSGKHSQRIVSGTPRRPLQMMSLVRKFTHFEGVYFAYYNAAFDLPKLLFQTATLGTYLTEGFPLPLIYFYVAMLMTNWAISFYRFQRAALDRNLVITRLFYLFDLFFAVFAPVIVLVYAYNHFALDRDVFTIRERTLSPGMFDRIAHIFADPVQVDLFRYAFHHLQLTKTWYFVCKSFLNILVLYKWKKIITYLVTQHFINLLGGLSQAGVAPSRIQPIEKEQAKVSHNWRTLIKRVVRVHGKRRHLFVGMIVFLTGMFSIPTYVIVSITSSLENCASIPQCRVLSYRWSRGTSHCPCIVFIDRDQSPCTFDAWINPPDATAPLVFAAKSGHLKTVQIVNRAIQDLPTELRHCEELEQLILVYSKTQALPGWVGEFHNLQYIHVESDFIHFPLHTLPLDLFSHTPKLRFIRFGGAAKLPVFPSLGGLHQLITLVISLAHELTVLPDFNDLHNLKTLIIADATHLQKLPSLQPLEGLTYFSLFRRNAMCCNGFIDGVCDLTTFQCMPRANEVPVICESSRLPPQDRDLLKRINGFVCSINQTSDVADFEPTVLSTDGLCAGVRFKQCELNGQRGICYNGRMQVIHCDTLGEYEAMRRLEIAQNVGEQCDPEVEAWLGCK